MKINLCKRQYRLHTLETGGNFVLWINDSNICIDLYVYITTPNLELTLRRYVDCGSNQEFCPVSLYYIDTDVVAGFIS